MTFTAWSIASPKLTLVSEKFNVSISGLILLIDESLICHVLTWKIIGVAMGRYAGREISLMRAVA